MAKDDVFFDDGEHGLEVEYMTCEDEHGKIVEPTIQFAILGNYANLTLKQAAKLSKLLADWVKRDKSYWTS